jgi:carboxypeptidase D
MVKARRSAGKQRVIFWFNVGTNPFPTSLHLDQAKCLYLNKFSSALIPYVLTTQGGPGCSSFDGSLMEVGPFRTVPASQTDSGKVELKLVEGGWEEFATVVFREHHILLLTSQAGRSPMLLQRGGTGTRGHNSWNLVDQPPGTGYSYAPTNGYLHELDQVGATSRYALVSLLHTLASYRSG